MLYFRVEVNWQKGQLYFLNNFSFFMTHNRYCFEEYLKRKKLVAAVAAAITAVTAELLLQNLINNN
jgi:hypothetical protein